MGLGNSQGLGSRDIALNDAESYGKEHYEAYILFSR